MLRSVRKIIAFYSLIGRRRLAPILIGGLLVTSPVILDLVVPLLVRKTIDILASTGRLSLDMVYLLGAVFAASLVLTYGGEILYLRGKFKAAADLRNRIFAQSFFLPWQRLRQRGSAYFATLINNQVNDAFLVLDYGYIRNIVMLARMVAILIIVLTWDRGFFLLFLLNVVVVVAYSEVIDRATHHHYSRGLELMRRATAYIVETFENIHEILAGEGRGKSHKRYERMVEEITDVALKAEFSRATLDKAMVDLPNYISRVLILLYGGFLVVNGRITIGTIWALWVYFSYLTEPLYVFRELAKIAVQSTATIEAVLDYFAETKRAREAFANRTLVPNPEAPVYVVRDLTFGFEPANPILNHVSFDVRRGELVAVVGLSGEGKSTLLNILLGFEQGYEGEVKFLGNELRGIFPGSVFEHLGYYSQTVGIFNDTLENNITLGRPLDARRLEEVITALEIGHLRGRLLGEGGSFLSGGERQRVQLARLFYGGKDVVVIDEPLTNLDLISERSLLGKLASYVAQRSGIIISHKPNVLRLATRVIVLRDGQVVADGALGELVHRDPICREIIHTYVDNALELSRELEEAADGTISS
jgi:ATP-binding cassette subfamily C protein